jgi:hypothetical protein
MHCCRRGQQVFELGALYAQSMVPTPHPSTLLIRTSTLCDYLKWQASIMYFVVLVRTALTPLSSPSLLIPMLRCSLRWGKILICMWLLLEQMALISFVKQLLKYDMWASLVTKLVIICVDKKMHYSLVRSCLSVVTHSLLSGNPSGNIK